VAAIDYIGHALSLVVVGACPPHQRARLLNAQALLLPPGLMELLTGPFLVQLLRTALLRGWVNSVGCTSRAQPSTP
jgi:hypothetical protein